MKTAQAILGLPNIYTHALPGSQRSAGRSVEVMFSNVLESDEESAQFEKLSWLLSGQLGNKW
jgi:hypothetical protein